MMPRLRLVHLGSGPVALLNSLATLSIHYKGSNMLFVDERMIIAPLSYLQELSIDVIGTDRVPSFPAASSSLFLPHLRWIRIASVDTDSGYRVTSSFFMKALSSWKLPSLQYLDIHSYGETHYADTLVGFLRSHGAVLRYMTLHYFNGGLMTSQDMLAAIFILCPHLRSIEVILENLPVFDLLPSSLNLEKLHISTHFEDQDTQADLYKKLKYFKSIAPTPFPKLLEAKFHQMFSVLRASFRTGDEFIRVVDRLSSSRYYDGGRVEIGALLSLASGML